MWAPFPFVEAPRLRERPTLVVSRVLHGGTGELLWVLMITSAANRGWPDDVSLESRFEECGLAVPCVIRTAKVSTVEARSCRRTGRLPADILQEVRAAISASLAL